MAISIIHANLAQPDRFNLGAKQDKACNVLLDKLVIEACTFILYIYFLLKYHV
jgi:hypothetical protein